MFCWRLFFPPHLISELRRPIFAKFSTILESIFYFIILVQNFEEAFPKNFKGEKHAKFGPISVDFKV